MHPARRRLAFLSAAIAALALVLPLASASAATVSAAGDRVGASHLGTIFTVRPDRPVSAGEGRCEPVPRADLAAGACVAAEDTAAAGEEASSGSDVLANCGESFTVGTKVLLASGAAVPISLLKPGDKVLATNTKTGKTFPETVTAVMVKKDT